MEVCGFAHFTFEGGCIIIKENICGGIPMNRFFPEMKKIFGFGCMRLPMIGDDIDTDAFCAMIDKFIEME